MKHIIAKKQIISLALIGCMAFAVPVFSATPAQAARKMPLTVTYNGKTVTLIKNIYSKNKSGVTYTSVKKSWGTGKVAKDTIFGGYKSITYKKKKTDIHLAVATAASEKMSDGYYKKGCIGSMGIEISNKNEAVNGVSIGMKKASAVKILKKAYGKKNVSVSKNTIELAMDEWMPITYSIKNGKVSKIHWFRS